MSDFDRLGDMLPPLEESKRLAKISCPMHGESEGFQYRLTSNSEWVGPICKACEREREQELELERVKIRERNERQRNESRIRDIFDRSGIPERFKTKDFQNYNPPTERAKKNLEICKNYAENFVSDARKTGRSLIFCGNRGTGKNHLACAIANHVIKRHQCTAMYTMLSHALFRVKQTYSRESKETQLEVIASMASVDLLILDEIDQRFDTPAEQLIIFELINARYERIKPTILLCNLDAEGVRNFIGDRCFDRLKEGGGGLLVFDWDSYR
jgi:DNA replication protein DnaC